MVPKNGTRVPKSQIPLSDAEFASAIGKALQIDLGGSHRAAKTVMAWTGVSNRTAHLWLHGIRSPSGRHLVMLAANSGPLLAAVLRLAGREKALLALDLEMLERRLDEIMQTVRALRAEEP